MVWLKLDEDINVTVRAEIIAQDRAEQRQLANMMSAAEHFKLMHGNRQLGATHDSPLRSQQTTPVRPAINIPKPGTFCRHWRLSEWPAARQSVAAALSGQAPPDRIGSGLRRALERRLRDGWVASPPASALRPGSASRFA